MVSSNSLLAACVTAAVACAQSLPQVDLGYQIQQASSFNDSAQLYNFSNIRYAQPPVGDLRFAAPVAPTGRNTTVSDGSVGSICPQADPAWLFISEEFIQYVAAGNESTFNFTLAQQQLNAYLESGALGAPDARTTEDCLFLDVFAPKAIFDNAASRKRDHPRQFESRAGGSGGAPVMVWIYGGGYTAGEKISGNPTGLIQASQADGGDGVIYVAMNYRLGALGWSAGPTFQASGGVSNAGLYDQRLAIEWVAKYIHLFGGDPNQITLFGESAGGGSIQHQITAYGGEKGVSFQQAIPQSPGFIPVPSQAAQENTTNLFLYILNVTSLAEARQLDSAAVIAANTLQVAGSLYGAFSYGPVADGIFAPEVPSLLLNSGAFAKNVSVMVGHNTNEGPLFAPPYVNTTPTLEAFLQATFPGITEYALNYIINVLYPAVFDGTYPWTNGFERTFTLIKESIFSCNTHYLNLAYDNQTYAYQFEVPPAFHGEDVAYTYYNNDGVSASVIAPAVAQVLQGYLTNFAMTGNPNGAGLPVFPMQGTNSSMNGLNVTGVTQQMDDSANQRCNWWQKALYY